MRMLFRLSGCYSGLRTRGPRDPGFVPTLRHRGFDQYGLDLVFTGPISQERGNRLS